jgi:hypothetical protein
LTGPAGSNRWLVADLAEREKHIPHQEHVVRGMLSAMAAFFLFTVMNVFAKMLSVKHSVVEIAFYRNLIACMPFLFMVFALGRRDILVIRSQPAAVGVRAVIGTVSLATTFAAYSLMPMAETTVLLFTSSLFIPVLGIIFLHERVGPYRWLCRRRDHGRPGRQRDGAWCHGCHVRRSHARHATDHPALPGAV